MNNQSYIEKEIQIKLPNFKPRGILTLPATAGPHPAIVILHGSDRSSADNPYFKNHAVMMVESGFAILRYDGPGWGGQRANQIGIETFEERSEEAIQIVKFLQSQPDIQSDKVGIWGSSQGGWICQMAAANYEDIAFIIPVSGPGVSPGEQEVYRIEAQSKAAGFSETDIHKALIIRRLMIDILLDNHQYQVENELAAATVGLGPWTQIMDFVYGTEKLDAKAELKNFIVALSAIKDEPWSEYLYLDMMLKILDSFPADEWETVKRQMRAVAMMNPGDYLPRVTCPVLAIFGAADKLVPVDRSVHQYQEHLKVAGNKDVTIHVFPEADHGIFVGKQFAPGYFDTVQKWLSLLAE